MLHRALRSIRIRLLPPRPQPLILMYHRIADEELDPWGNVVSPKNFQEHLDVLRRKRHPTSLLEFVRKYQDGTLSSRAVAITFDDGYVDNLIAGKPHLAAADMPATVFLATGYLGRGEFWWDELARLILVGPGPAKLEMTIGCEQIRLNLDGDSQRETGWRAWLDSPRTARQAAYLVIWERLRVLEPQERQSVMAELRGVFAGRCEMPVSGRSMTPEEVNVLVRDRLVAIGPHTVSHPTLTELDHVSIRRELVESKKTCESLAGGEVSAFAYPFGFLDAEVRAAVSDAGFTCACSTKFSPVRAGSDVFALPRIHVINSDGDAFERSLRHATLANG